MIVKWQNCYKNDANGKKRRKMQNKIFIFNAWVEFCDQYMSIWIRALKKKFVFYSILFPYAIINANSVLGSTSCTSCCGCVVYIRCICFDRYHTMCVIQSQVYCVHTVHMCDGLCSEQTHFTRQIHWRAQQTRKVLAVIVTVKEYWLVYIEVSSGFRSLSYIPLAFSIKWIVSRLRLCPIM